MPNETQLQRFLEAQETSYATALAEIKSGRKQSHWMWYIFPQIKGLGVSSTAQFYSLVNAQEAAAFLQHSVLGSRLVHISEELLKLPGHNATHILGSPDDMKLKSSMTLFATLPHTNPVFQAILDKFYQGQPDQRTLQLLQQ